MLRMQKPKRSNFLGLECGDVVFLHCSNISLVNTQNAAHKAAFCLQYLIVDITVLEFFRSTSWKCLHKSSPAV
jgi:hypothetical protein